MASPSSAETLSKKSTKNTSIGVDSKTAVLEHAANEVVFAVVGHVGSGTSTIARVLAGLLGSSSLQGGKFDVEILAARSEIETWAKSNQRVLPETERTDLATSVGFQNLGDDMRLSCKDNSAVARALIQSIPRNSSKEARVGAGGRPGETGR